MDNHGTYCQAHACSVVAYGYESWTIGKAKQKKMNAFEF